MLLMAPNCATTTQDLLSLKGEGFPPNVRGAVLWHPAGSDTTRGLTEFRADQSGSFAVDFTMPDNLLFKKNRIAKKTTSTAMIAIPEGIRSISF